MRWIPIVTSDEFEELESAAAARVLSVRYRTLVDAGVEPGDALVAAGQAHIPVEDVIALVQRGCPSHTALRILF